MDAINLDWAFLLSFLISGLASTIRLTVPLLFASVGELFSERSGILNIGLEGYMLAGALGGYLGSYYTGDPWVGVLLGITAGGLMALVHAYVSVTLAADQIVSGVALNMLGLGLTTYLFRITTPHPAVNAFEEINIPMISQLPIIGPILFQHTIFTYLLLLMVPICAIVMLRTTLGLKIRAVGEHPLAAETMGVNVFHVRYLCVLFAGVMAGLGGTSLSLGVLGGRFSEGMSAGRGFLALAVVILAEWRVYRSLIWALVFGGTWALIVRLQAVGFPVPYPLLLIIPYALAMVTLAGVFKKVRAPKALCVPYRKPK